MGHQILHLAVAFLVAKPPAPGFLHHRVRHGVGKVLLQTSSKTEHLCFFFSVEGNDLRYPGAGMGKGAGLVKDDGVCPGNRLQEFAALDGDVLSTRLPHGGEHRKGHRQFQRTGKVHHQHRQGPCHVPGEGQAQKAPGESVGHQFVCQVGRPGLAGRLHLLGPLDHLHDLVIPALAGSLFHIQDALAFLHHSTGVYRAAGPLGHGDGLSGEGTPG